MKTATSVLLGFQLAFMACDNDPARSKARATVQEPVVATRAASVGDVAANAYSFSNAGSSIEFVGAKLTRKHAGKLGRFRGSIQLVDNEPAKSFVSVTIDMASIDSDDPKLTRHLKSPDFFDVEKFPKATFTSTSIVAEPRAGATHTITGNLELHGVTKQLAFPAQIKRMSAAVEATAEFSINRKDFGVAYSGMAGDLIKEEVLLMLRLDARRP
jgi:polyisoprenoid-binding protein YceI